MRKEHWGMGPGWGRGAGGRAEPPPADDAVAWISGALPDDWFTGSPEVTIDRDEIIMVGRLAEPTLADDATDADRAAAEQGRVASFRESTRERRIGIARQLEHRYKRKVGWGVDCGGTREVFTTLSAPVMTRLRQARPAGARHAGRLRGGAVQVGRAGLVRQPGRPARRVVAG